MREDRQLCIDDETRKVGRTSHGAWRLYLWGLQSIDPARHSGVVRPAGNFVVGHWKFLSGENSSTNRWNGRWRPSGASQCYVLVCARVYTRVRVCIYNIYNTEPAPLSQTSSVHVQLNPPRVNNIERVGAKEGVANNPPLREIRGEIARVNPYLYSSRITCPLKEKTGSLFPRYFICQFVESFIN